MSLLLKSLTRLDTRPLSAASEDEIAEPLTTIAVAGRYLPDDSIGQLNLVPVESNPALPDVTPTTESIEFGPIAPPQPIAVLEPVKESQIKSATAVTVLPSAPAPTADPTSQSLTQLERLLALELHEPTATLSIEPPAQPIPLLPLLPASLPTETPATTQPTALAEVHSAPITVSISPPPAPPAKPLQLRQEFRELRDHLLTKFPLQQHATLLFVDAGRTPTDASWLVPFATSLLDYLTTQNESAAPLRPTTSQQQTPRILIVEAAGDQSEIARSLGLETGPGLAEIARRELPWSDALQSTPHPSIQLLSAGEKSLGASQSTALADPWPELKNEFDLILIAAGPIPHQSTDSQSAKPTSNSIPATTFFPLVDAAILCVEVDATPRLAAENAKRILTAAGLNLLGCVVRQETPVADQVAGTLRVSQPALSMRQTLWPTV